MGRIEDLSNPEENQTDKKIRSNFIKKAMEISPTPSDENNPYRGLSPAQKNERVINDFLEAIQVLQEKAENIQRQTGQTDITVADLQKYDQQQTDHMLTEQLSLQVVVEPRLPTETAITNLEAEYEAWFTDPGRFPRDAVEVYTVKTQEEIKKEANKYIESENKMSELKKIVLDIKDIFNNKKYITDKDKKKFNLTADFINDDNAIINVRGVNRWLHYEEWRNNKKEYEESYSIEAKENKDMYHQIDEIHKEIEKVYNKNNIRKGELVENSGKKPKINDERQTTDIDEYRENNTGMDTDERFLDGLDVNTINQTVEVGRLPKRWKPDDYDDTTGVFEEHFSDDEQFFGKTQQGKKKQSPTETLLENTSQYQETHTDSDIVWTLNDQSTAHQPINPPETRDLIASGLRLLGTQHYDNNGRLEKWEPAPDLNWETQSATWEKLNDYIQHSTKDLLNRKAIDCIDDPTTHIRPDPTKRNVLKEVKKYLQGVGSSNFTIGKQQYEVITYYSQLEDNPVDIWKRTHLLADTSGTTPAPKLYATNHPSDLARALGVPPSVLNKAVNTEDYPGGSGVYKTINGQRTKIEIWTPGSRENQGGERHLQTEHLQEKSLLGIHIKQHTEASRGNVYILHKKYTNIRKIIIFDNISKLSNNTDINIGYRTNQLLSYRAGTSRIPGDLEIYI